MTPTTASADQNGQPLVVRKRPPSERHRHIADSDTDAICMGGSWAWAGEGGVTTTVTRRAPPSISRTEPKRST